MESTDNRTDKWATFQSWTYLAPLYLDNRAPDMSRTQYSIPFLSSPAGIAVRFPGTYAILLTCSIKTSAQFDGALRARDTEDDTLTFVDNIR